MIDLARSRLGPRTERVRFVRDDFRRLREAVPPAGELDVVFSSYALHHLDAQDKRDVLRQALELLRPGGWLLNADLVVAQDAQVEERIQQIRVAGVVQRAGDTGAQDARFADAASTRAFLDDLEARDGDQPQTLSEDLRIAREAGLDGVEIFWKEYREVVFGGTKPT
jgi:tRNA (cmo5U34)-methyltransferase